MHGNWPGTHTVAITALQAGFTPPWSGRGRGRVLTIVYDQQRQKYKYYYKSKYYLHSNVNI